MEKEHINGLRIFLQILLSMISHEEKEKCTFVENALSNGIATLLWKKYPAYFQDLFNEENLQILDNYFRRWVGCADGVEFRKYSCEEKDGILLLIALALNDLR